MRASPIETEKGVVTYTADDGHLIEVLVRPIGVMNGQTIAVKRVAICDGFVWIENNNEQTAFNTNDVRRLREVKLGENDVNKH